MATPFMPARQIIRVICSLSFLSVLHAQDGKPASDLLTPKDRAIQMLQRAESEILHMSPPIKSGLCSQIMHAYIKTEYRQDLIRSAKTCFRAAVEIQDD